jgi:hypothetical protein
MTFDDWFPAKPQKPIDWAKVADVTVRILDSVQAGLQEQARRAKEQAPETQNEARRAAALLGVSLDASADEIRRALRVKLGSSRLHPDHGGDGVEAARLIAAKNLLIDRVRS